MTPAQILGVAALLAVLLPIVLLVSGFLLLRQRWRIWRTRRYCAKQHREAYRSYRASR